MTAALVGGNVARLDFDGVESVLRKHEILGAQLYPTNFQASSCRPEPVAAWPGAGHPATGGALASSFTGPRSSRSG